MQFYTKYYFPFCMIFLIVEADAKKRLPFWSSLLLWGINRCLRGLSGR